MNRSGHTLIELLAVIAILAVLTAILMPLQWKAKERAYIARVKLHGRNTVFAQYCDMIDRAE